MAACEWLLLPVAGSVMLCLLLVPLGYQVIARGVIFADLAIAQWAALGTLAGVHLLGDQMLAGASVSSLLFALLAALAVHLILQRVSRGREAWIGVLYVLGANLAVLLVSGDPHGAQALQSSASGDLLWAAPPLVWATSVLVLCVWVMGFCYPEWMVGRAFLPVFAVAVTYTVALAGIYVVFATLIITPLFLRRMPPFHAAFVAISGHLAGLVCSVTFDLPVGPAVVVAMLGVTLMVYGALRLLPLRPGQPAQV